MYTPLRSQLLMQNPLPLVETAYTAIQQEETQRNVLNLSLDYLDVSAMFSKGASDNNRFCPNKSINCTACGGKGHNKIKCWTIVGFPK